MLHNEPSPNLAEYTRHHFIGLTDYLGQELKQITVGMARLSPCHLGLQPGRPETGCLLPGSWNHLEASLCTFLVSRLHWLERRAQLGPSAKDLHAACPCALGFLTAWRLMNQEEAVWPFLLALGGDATPSIVLCLRSGHKPPTFQKYFTGTLYALVID